MTAKLHSKAKAPDSGTHHCVRGSFATYLHFERLHLEIVSHQPPHRSVKCVAFSGHLCHQYFRNSSDLSDLFAGASVFSEVVSCLFRWDLLWYWSSRNGRKSTISAFGWVTNLSSFQKFPPSFAFRKMIKNEILFQLSQSQLIIFKGLNDRLVARMGFEWPHWVQDHGPGPPKKKPKAAVNFILSCPLSPSRRVNREHKSRPIGQLAGRLATHEADGNGEMTSFSLNPRPGGPLSQLHHGGGRAFFATPYYLWK